MSRGKPKPERSPLPRIDGYHIEGVLGRGATGVVYSAVQLAVDRPVAIKILHPELVGSKNAVRRLQREARTAARLAHPGIISAIDMGEQDGLWWYAMELVEGISLGERLDERGPMGEREALRFFLPLIDALQHAFEAGVVHRDIKPSNILVDAHGRARLVDLGLAFAENDPMLTKSGGTLGTPHYISPEQARDPGAANTQSDQWSLGATMYHAVCGRPPFEGESVAEILSGVLYQRVPDPRLFAPQLSKGFALVLRKCLTRDPAGRYPSPAALLEDLELVVERRQPEVRVSALDPVDDGRPPWVRKALVAGAATILVVLALWRPWVGPAPRLTPPVTARVSWPALDTLHELYLDPEGALTIADATSRLAGLAPVPEGGEALRASFRERLMGNLVNAIGGLRREVGAEFEAQVSQHHLLTARQVLDRVPAELERRTGYSASSELPPLRSRSQLQAWQRQMEEQLGKARTRERAEGSAKLMVYLRQAVFPRFEQALAEHRWADAQELLRPRPEWLDAAEVEAELSTVDVQFILRGHGELLSSRRNRIFPDFKAVMSGLDEFLEEQDARLREEVRNGGRIGAAVELLARFDGQLDKLGVSADQIPSDYDLLDPLRGRLNVLAPELEEYETRILQGDAVIALREDRAQADADNAARRYDEALALWNQRLSDPLRTAVHSDVLFDRKREAELLEGLMVRAARQVRARHGQKLSITIGGITHRGARVLATATPAEILGDGFMLELPGLDASVHMLLRRPAVPQADGEPVLQADDLLALVGLADMPSGAGEQFLRALFLYYEGRYGQARASLPVGPFADSRLLPPLRERIDAALARAERELSSRRGQMEQLRRQLLRALTDRHSTAQAMLLDGQRLLGEFGDLLDAEQRAEIEDICAACELRLRPRSLAETYPTAVIEQGRNRRVSLEWNFESGSRGAWELGDWQHLAAQGRLYMARPHEDAAGFWSRDGALRLPLGPHLEVDQDVTLVLRLRWAEDHDGFDNDLVLSLAGTHVIFADGRPAGEEQGWTVTRDDPRGVLERLHAEGDQRFSGFSGFPRGESSFELRVVFRRGRVEVSIDGRELKTPMQLVRTAEPADPELVLRSWYKLELFDVRLEVTQVQ
jgi:Protein kinase domain